jgi:hypothetical protein
MTAKKPRSVVLAPALPTPQHQSEKKQQHHEVIEENVKVI